MTHTLKEHYDVVIVGAGLAGLTLARHLLLYTDRTILLIDKRSNPAREAPQKYGESLVQASGYYLAKVLDLEEYLLTNHYFKYNLRFHWPTYGLENRRYEDYSQSYIRSMSNVGTYQLDRNFLEEHLLAANLENQRCQFIGGVRNTAADLSEAGGLHRVHFDGGDVRCRWLVDASGRSKILQRQLGLAEMNPIRHSAIFCWVDGLVNVEKLTDRSRSDILHSSRRRQIGHLPIFLGTNHFCAEGQWLWVIPLHHKTSLGLVYDHGAVDPDEISNTRKMIDHVCRTWPLLARDLPHRKIIDEGRMIDFSHSCRQTISPQRWALVGDAGRFSDPLYSPGTDLISIYNTLIVDAIQAEDSRTLEEKCQLAEQIQRVMYESYVPSYSVSYDCLGDQETFTLKYSWELAIYFGFFVLPMINNLFANAEFMPVFLRRFAILGPLNANLQRYLSAFFQWKKQQGRAKLDAPDLFELYDVTPLREAETLFYETGLRPQEAIQVVDRHLERLKEFARYIIAHLHASVVGDREVLTNAPFIASLKFRDVTFDPEQMKAAYSRYSGAKEIYRWNLDPFALERFIRQPAAEPVGAQLRT